MTTKSIIVTALIAALLSASCKNNSTQQNSNQSDNIPSEESNASQAEGKKINAKQFFKDNIAKVKQLCNEEAAQDIYDLDAAQYAYIDIDSDGIEELYIRDQASECGWLLCCGADSVQFIASESYKLHFSKLGNIIMLSGSAGTGTFYIGYFQIEKSICTGPDFYELQEYVFDGDSTRTVYYPKDEYENKYSPEKTKPFFDNIEKIKATGTDWELLTEGLKWNQFCELVDRITENIDG